jgi:hypothetical protein
MNCPSLRVIQDLCQPNNPPRHPTPLLPVTHSINYPMQHCHLPALNTCSFLRHPRRMGTPGFQNIATMTNSCPLLRLLPSTLVHLLCNTMALLSITLALSQHITHGLNTHTNNNITAIQAKVKFLHNTIPSLNSIINIRNSTINNNISCTPPRLRSMARILSFLTLN